MSHPDNTLNKYAHEMAVYLQDEFDIGKFTHWNIRYFAPMSIEVKNLLKIYGEQKAVNNISFKVDKGEIVGFLGPNGAGKSTTMKIITGYLDQSDCSHIFCRLPGYCI